MDEFQNRGQFAFEHAVSAPEAGEAIAESLTAERPNLRLADRLKHIHDHRVDTRDSPTARTIALRGVCSDLMEVEAYVAEALRDAVTATPLTTENIEQSFSPSIDLVIRLARQISQMSQLEIRASGYEG
jgi:hypothetical protein